MAIKNTTRALAAIRTDLKRLKELRAGKGTIDACFSHLHDTRCVCTDGLASARDVSEMCNS